MLEKAEPIPQKQTIQFTVPADLPPGDLTCCNKANLEAVVNELGDVNELLHVMIEQCAEPPLADHGAMLARLGSLASIAQERLTDCIDNLEG